MNKFNVTVILLTLIAAISGCAQQQPQAATASQAIEQSKTKGSVDEQAKYLISQANAFVNSQKFDEAIKSAKYVLANLDANSQEAKSIVERATAEIKKMAEAKAGELKQKLGSLGN